MNQPVLFGLQALRFRLLFATIAIGAALGLRGADDVTVFLTLGVGDEVTMNATSDGNPGALFQWVKDGASIPNATGSSFTLANVSHVDSAAYNVTATNAYGWVLSNDIVITVGKVTATAPFFTSEPASQTVKIGGTVTFTVGAVGLPVPTIQWRKDGITIGGATTSTLTVTQVNGNSGGTYSAIATNSVGYATSRGAVLSVNTPPVFTTQPVSATASSGSTLTFNAAAAGFPSPAYQWKKNGVVIPNATGASLTLVGIQTSDAGTYAVVATNIAGAAMSANALLTVTQSAVAPKINTQPLGQTAAKKSAVTFTVTATGSPAPTYQWMKNAAVVKGATSASLTITGIKPGDAGTYTVVATNTAGSVSSNAAVLKVGGN